MPPVRDAAVAALRARVTDVRPAVLAIANAADAQARTQAVTALLSERGFALGGDDAPEATFVAHTARLDRAAMRRGLRHGHIGVLVTEGDPLAAAASTWLALSIAAVLDAEAEYASLTVVGVPQDERGLAGRRIAESGLLDEADVLFALEPTTAGDAFPRTINRTGEALAGSTGRVTLADGATRDSLLERIQTQTWDDSVQVRAQAADDAAINLTLRATTSMAVWKAQQALAGMVAGAEGAEVDFAPIQDDLIVNRLVQRRVKTYGDTAKHKWDRIVGGEPRDPHPFGALSYVAPLTLVPFRGDADATADVGEEAVADASDAAEPSDGLPPSLAGIVEYTALTALDLIRDASFRALADDQLVRALRERGLTREHRRWTGVHRVLPEDADVDTRRPGPKLTNFTVITGPQPENVN